MSGYSDDAIASRGAVGSVIHFIAKPFSAETLTRTIRDVLDAV